MKRYSSDWYWYYVINYTLVIIIIFPIYWTLISSFKKPNELITNGEFTSNINSWTTIAGSGSAAYNSTGNGRLRLNDFAAHQSISTIVGRLVTLEIR